MKKVHVTEVSNDGKRWFRAAVRHINKNKRVANWGHELYKYKYSRFRIIKVPNATKLRNLL